VGSDQYPGEDEPDHRAQPDALEEGDANERRRENDKECQENGVEIHAGKPSTEL
jgi:hypothetical protein